RLVYTLAITVVSTDEAVAEKTRQATPPVSLRLENELGQARDVAVPRGTAGPVYVPIDPFPAKALLVQPRSAKTVPHAPPMAIVDLRFIGLEL
ncbi:MAG: hypothetical protein J6Z50_08350, partial [Fibrobacterales bacterium]|nr:hypothetical protein [Fibrobacterales bacterium]